MSRVDLPPGFGGWQTVLASGHSGESIGPVPVYAIKKGHTSYCEGAQTLLISLNADKVRTDLCSYLVIVIFLYYLCKSDAILEILDCVTRWQHERD